MDLQFDIRLFSLVVTIIVTWGLSYIFYPAINLWIHFNSFAVDEEDLRPELIGSGMCCYRRLAHTSKCL